MPIIWRFQTYPQPTLSWESFIWDNGGGGKWEKELILRQFESMPLLRSVPQWLSRTITASQSTRFFIFFFFFPKLLHSNRIVQYRPIYLTNPSPENTSAEWTSITTRPELLNRDRLAATYKFNKFVPRPSPESAQRCLLKHLSTISCQVPFLLRRWWKTVRNGQKASLLTVD